MQNNENRRDAHSAKDELSRDADFAEERPKESVAGIAAVDDLKGEKLDSRTANSSPIHLLSSDSGIWSRVFTRLAASMMFLVWITSLGYSVHFRTQTSLSISFLQVVGGTFLVGATFAIFCAKAFRQVDSKRQFNIASLLLLVIPVSIYLQAAKVLIPPVDFSQMATSIFIDVFLINGSFLFFSTVVILWFTEAVLSVLVFFHRANRAMRIKRDLVQAKEGSQTEMGDGDQSISKLE